MKIVSLSGDEPHPDYGGWERFLAEHCEVRDTADGVTFYGAVNCNYIIWPCGTMLQNYGYHGRAIMSLVKKEGAAKVLADVKDGIAQVDEVLADATRFLNRPCAAPGLTSYRYRTRTGWGMIGAKDHADAMREAGRLGVGEPDPSRLEVWDGEKYVPVALVVSA